MNACWYAPGPVTLHHRHPRTELRRGSAAACRAPRRGGAVFLCAAAYCVRPGADKCTARQLLDPTACRYRESRVMCRPDGTFMTGYSAICSMPRQFGQKMFLTAPSGEWLLANFSANGNAHESLCASCGSM